jgi:hypothetical protein
MRLDSELVGFLPNTKFPEISHAESFMGTDRQSPSFTGEELRDPALVMHVDGRRIDVRDAGSGNR